MASGHERVVRTLFWETRHHLPNIVFINRDSQNLGSIFTIHKKSSSGRGGKVDALNWNTVFQAQRGPPNSSKLLFLLAGLLLASFLFAAPVGYFGTVTDLSGNLFPQPVTVEWTNQNLSTSTDNYGIFLLDINSSGLDEWPTTPFLKQNYPNPFNPATHIELNTTEAATVSIYNILGQRVNSLKLHEAGLYTLAWGGQDEQGRNLSAGIYLLTLHSSGHSQSIKMALLDGGQSGLHIVSAVTLPPSFSKNAVSDDTLHFSSGQMSPRQLIHSPVSDLVYLGEIPCNASPRFLNAVLDTALALDDTLNLSLTMLCYNDDAGTFSIISGAGILSGENYGFVGDSLGVFASVILATEASSPRTDTLTVRVTVYQPNRPPVFHGPIPPQECSEDSSLRMVPAQYFSDADGDTLNYFIENLINASQILVNDTLIVTPEPDWCGILENLRLLATDPSGDTAESRPFWITVNPVNDAPTQTSNIENQELWQGDTLTLIMNNYVTDIDNDTLNYSLLTEELIAWNQEGNTLKIIPDTSITHDINNLIITASDNDTSINLEPFNIEIKPLNKVLFIIKDYYTDSTLTSDTSTFWIDSTKYEREGGTLQLKLKNGTYEYNATNPNTLDGKYWYCGENYLFLRRPGDTDNFEQRDRFDNSSPITITKNDTIIAYKLTLDFPLLNALNYFGETKRFSSELDSVPCWWNTNFMTPDSLRRLYTHELLALIDEIPYIRDVNFYYIESNVTPTTPFWELAMSFDFAPPGTNITFYNEYGEIVGGSAKGPPGTFYRHEVFIESLQAITNMTDNPTDPPILTSTGNGIIINDLGKKLLSFIYFVWPNTKI
jgi:hypothetical protein